MNQTRTFDKGEGAINGPFAVTTHDDGTMTLTLCTGKTMPIDDHGLDRIIRYAIETTSEQYPAAAVAATHAFTCTTCGTAVDYGKMLCSACARYHIAPRPVA